MGNKSWNYARVVIEVLMAQGQLQTGIINCPSAADIQNIQALPHNHPLKAKIRRLDAPIAKLSLLTPHGQNCKSAKNSSFLIFM